MLKIAFSAALLGLLYSQVDWSRVAPLLGNVGPWAFAALLALYTANRILMALKWHQLLHVLDKRLSRPGAIRVYYESSFVGFAMPLGGLGPDIVRYLRLRGRGIASHITLVSIIVERYVGLIATLAVVVFGALTFAAIAPEPALAGFARLTAAGALAAAVGAAVVLLVPRARRGARRLIARSRKLEAKIAKHTAAASTYSTRRGVLVANFGLSLLEQTTPIWSYWIGSRALDTPLPLAVCIAVAPIVVVVQRLPISYGGLGLREGSAAALLVALGYDYSEAMVMLMLLFVMFFVSLLPGAVIFKRSPPPAEAAIEQPSATALSRAPTAAAVDAASGPLTGAVAPATPAAGAVSSPRACGRAPETG